MNDDLIKRSDAIKDLCDISNNSDMPNDWHRGMSVAISALYRVPPVPPADRPQGEWTCRDLYWHTAICSNCNKVTMFEEWGGEIMEYNYCPNCGARMKGADDE